MDGQQTGSIDTLLDGFGRSVEAVFGLPAVPTLDWCDRAAQAVARLVEPAIAVVTIGTLTDSGELVEHEVTGVGARQPSPESGRARPLNRDQIGFRGEDGRVGTLRVRAANLRRVGIQLAGEDRNRTVVGGFGDLLTGELATSGELASLWSGLETGEPIVAVVPLSQPGDGRVMIVQLASSTPGALPEGVEQALASLLNTLRQRTVQALGAERAESTRWLTEREQLVLEHLTLGKSVRQIADELGRSPHTVHDHVKSLHRKLGASSRGELIARALGHVASTSARPITQAEPKPVKPEPARSETIEPKPAPDSVPTEEG